MPNAYRELLARAIEQNGGYSRHYESFALSFVVGLYYADLSAKHLYTVAKKEHAQLPPLTPAIDWNADDECEWCQSVMSDSLRTDCYKTYSNETAKRFGLPYHTVPWLKYWRKRSARDIAYYLAKVPGWAIVNPYCNEEYRADFGLYGRCGKHLCVESFEGRSLKMSADDLAEAIRNDDRGDYPNKWCQRLLAMLTEWNSCFTSHKASAELEYIAADQLVQRLIERGGAWRAALAEARKQKAARIAESAAREYWASRDVLTVEG